MVPYLTESFIYPQAANRQHILQNTLGHYPKMKQLLILRTEKDRIIIEGGRALITNIHHSKALEAIDEYLKGLSDG